MSTQSDESESKKNGMTPAVEKNGTAYAIDTAPSEPNEESKIELPNLVQGTRDATEEKRLILEQVEYYFGDINLPKDRFLKELINRDSERWVPLTVIRTFKKMQIYKNNDLIVEALRESPELLEVDESGTKIRRKNPIRMPIPEHIKNTPMWKTIYAKGFDTANMPSQVMVEDFFNKHGKCIKAFPRKDNDERFKGSYFILFESHAEAKRVTEMDLEFNDTKLITMMKFDYCEMKCIEKGLDPDTMRKQAPNARKNTKDLQPKYVNNCLLNFEGAGPNANWESIRNQMDSDYGKVLFVKFNMETKSGIIHFEDPIAMKVAASIPNDELEFDGIKPKVYAIDGEEEMQYYINRKHDSKNKNHSRKRAHRGNANEAKEHINDESKSDVKPTSVPDISSSIAGHKRKSEDTADSERSPEIKSAKLDPES